MDIQPLQLNSSVLVKPNISMRVLLILVFINVVLLALTGYLYLQNQQLAKQIIISQTNTPLPVAINPTASISGETPEWEVYSADKFSFKYPAGWQVERHLAASEVYVLRPSTGIFDKSSVNSITVSITNHCLNTQCLTIFNLDDMYREIGAKKIIKKTTIDGLMAYKVTKSDGKTAYIFINGPDFYTLSTDIYQLELDQVFSTFKLSPLITPTPTPSSPLVPLGWKAFPYPAYQITMYAPKGWNSNSQDFPSVPSSLIRFWLGATPDTSTIQLDIKNSWANTGDAPYLLKNFIVGKNISAVRVDPPLKSEKVLDRYQTNVYFEHGINTYVFTCVHNWLSEQIDICDTMLKTIEFSN